VIVRRRENDDRRLRQRTQPLDHLDPRKLRQLDVQKYGIRLLAFDCLDRCCAVACLADVCRPRHIRDQRCQATASEWFVIDDESRQHPVVPVSEDAPAFSA
jgi:hypothetical protein